MASSLSKKLQAASSKSAKVRTGSVKPTLVGAEKLVDQVAEAKQALVDQIAAYEQLEQTLTSQTKQIYSDARKDGNYSSSIFAKGDQSNGLMVVYSDKFSALPIEMEDELRKLDPKFDDHFVESRELKVRKNAGDGKTITDNVIEELMKKLGEARFNEIFDVKVAIAPRKGTAEIWEQLPVEIRNQLRQADPSVRNVTEDGKVV